MVAQTGALEAPDDTWPHLSTRHSYSTDRFYYWNAHVTACQGFLISPTNEKSVLMVHLMTLIHLSVSPSGSHSHYQHSVQFWSSSCELQTKKGGATMPLQCLYERHLFQLYLKIDSQLVNHSWFRSVSGVKYCTCSDGVLKVESKNRRATSNFPFCSYFSLHHTSDSAFLLHLLLSDGCNEIRS